MTLRLTIALLLLACLTAQAQNPTVGKNITYPLQQGVFNVAVDDSGSFILSAKGGTVKPVRVQFGNVIGIKPKLNRKANFEDVNGLYLPTLQKFNKSATGNAPNNYIDSAGVFHALSGYTASEPIKATPLTTYITTSKQYVAFYDSSLTVIPSVVGSRVRGTVAFVTPAKTAYLRITVPPSELDYFQLQQGSSIVVSQRYQKLVDGETMNALASYAQIQRNRAGITAIAPGKNLYNKTDGENIDGSYITADSAKILAAVGYSVTHFMSVSGNATYTPNGTKQNIAFFDSLRRPLYAGAAVGRATLYFTTTPETRFIRSTVFGSKDNYQLEAGTSTTPKAPYQLTAPLETPQGNTNQQLLIQAKILSIPTTTGKNQYNKSDTTLITGNQVGFFVDSSGATYTNASYTISPYMPLTGDGTTVYYASDKQYIAYYDQYGKPLGVGASAGRATGAFTPTTATRFIRATVFNVNKNTFQIERNTTSTSYASYQLTADMETLTGTSALTLAQATSTVAASAYTSATATAALLPATRNLADPAKFLTNFYIADTGGSPVSNGSVSETGWVPAKGLTVYTTNNPTSQFVTFYSDTLLSARIGGASYLRGVASFTTVSGTKYLRATLLNSVKTFPGFQLEEATIPTSFVPYGNQILASSVKFSSGAQGKNVLVIGTSIPWGSGYYEAACANLGCNVINRAVPSSSMRGFAVDGTWNNTNSDNITRSFILSKAEKDSLYNNWGTLYTHFSNSPSGTVTPTDSTYWRNASIDDVLKHVNGTPGYAQADVLFISALYNDRSGFGTETDAQFITVPTSGTARTARNTAAGSFNNAIDQFLKAKPSLKIVVESHYENVLEPKVFMAQQNLAYYNQLSFVDQSGSGFSQVVMPGTASLRSTAPWNAYGGSGDLTRRQYFMPDLVHPYSANGGITEGKARDILRLNIEAELRKTFGLDSWLALAIVVGLLWQRLKRSLGIGQSSPFNRAVRY